mgnify:CR=1 FL=1
MGEAPRGESEEEGGVAQGHGEEDQELQECASIQPSPKEFY